MINAGLCASSHTECASNPFDDAGAHRCAYAWTHATADAGYRRLRPDPARGRRQLTPLPGAPTKRPFSRRRLGLPPSRRRARRARRRARADGVLRRPVEERPCGSADCGGRAIQSDDDAQSFLDAGTPIIGGPLTIQGTASLTATAR